ncbi:TlpA family protein disulfide reductase [Demequina zhanjiangensis]|uniref:TlpA disulfide reductase family protein n=1 Tax=Demequina zhanjiangensis TaxID=3051659 RepID=A0ABT8FWV6_9MICO|nr:TlpA disulfide reductase family protein [Demequina sp. SYSU T00b26]MDN4471385.1 TlpA disulfide reductase family protein [Demequina sp. SYSU T00b26]
MKRGSRLIILAAIVLAIVLALTACAPEDAPQSPGYVSGDGTVTIFSDDDRADLPLTGTAFDGTEIDVADWRGEVVVINTWYAACPPCRAEAPDLAALDAEDGVQLVGVNSRDGAETADAFDRTFGIEYPSIDDNDGGATAQLQGVIAINAVPTTLVLDPEGRLYARAVGRIEPSTLRSLVEEAAAATGLELSLTDVPSASPAAQETA